LDLVCVAGSNKCAVWAEVEAVNVISDHFPITVTVTWPEQDSQAAAAPFPEGYGLRSEVPAHLRRKPVVSASRTSAQMKSYRDQVDGALAGAVPVAEAELESELLRLEGLVLEKAYAAGICSRSRAQSECVRVYTVHQRQLERARQRLRVAQALPEAEPTREHRVRQAADAVDALERRKVEEFPARRRAMRRRAQLAEAEANATVQQWWADGEAGLLAQRMTAEQAGLRETRKRIPFLPRSAHQTALYAKEQFVRAKYSNAPDTDWPSLLVGLDPAEPALPTLVEVETAVKQLNGNSSAIGVPIFPLRWATTPPLLQRLWQLVRLIWQSGEVPDSFCVAEAVALKKPQPPGAPPAFRIIGVGLRCAGCSGW